MKVARTPTFMNLESTSFFFCSSEVGSPMAFCRWSYIIFSTVCLVSPGQRPSGNNSSSHNHNHNIVITITTINTDGNKSNIVTDELCADTGVILSGYHQR
jgi:hypothetical protein